MAESNVSPPKKTVKTGSLIILILVLSIAVAGIFLFAFNIANTQDRVIAIFTGKPLTDDTINMELEEIIQERQALEKDLTHINSLKIELDKERSSLDKLERELQQKAIQLEEKEEEINILKEQLSVEIADFQELVKTFESMESEEAAALILNMIKSESGNKDIPIKILKNMKTAKKAEILGIMTGIDSDTTSMVIFQMSIESD